MEFRDFSKPLEHGQCDVCGHSGKDCRCFKKPRKALQKFLEGMRAKIEQDVATLEAAELHYAITPNLPQDKVTGMDLFRAQHRFNNPDEYTRKGIAEYGLKLLAEVERNRAAKNDLPFTLNEIGNTYVHRTDQFVVSLMVGYCPHGDGIKTPQEAVAAALRLVKGSDADDTNWYCFDRNTEQLHLIRQQDVEDSN